MEHWNSQFSIDTPATTESIWKILSNVSLWPEWNAGIERIEMDGPFASASWFCMTPPGQEPIRSMLTDVRENECFVDETRVGDLLVRVAHRISNAGEGSRRITYGIEAQGPEAATIGPMIAADFPDVLAALAARAEGRTS